MEYLNKKIIEEINSLKIGVFELEIEDNLKIKSKSKYFGLSKDEVTNEYQKQHPKCKVIKITRLDDFVHNSMDTIIFLVSKKLDNLENYYLLYKGLYFDKTKELSQKLRDIFLREFASCKAA